MSQRAVKEQEAAVPALRQAEILRHTSETTIVLRLTIEGQGQ